MTISLDECWLWAGSKSEKGYGRTYIWSQGRSVTLAAHRAVYEALVGEIPEGLFVLHKCDTPPCVNPDHLFVGTQKDNMQDMLSKGRAKLQAYLNTAKTHCPKAHEYTPENTRIDKDGGRHCNQCSRERSHHAKV